MISNAWEYTGELAYSEQAPVTVSVWSCGTCGALASAAGKDQHEQWHAAQQPAVPVKPATCCCSEINLNGLGPTRMVATACPLHGRDHPHHPDYVPPWARKEKP